MPTRSIELGSGTSEKTLLLLDAFAATGQLRRFVPFDVSEATLLDAAARIDQRYPGTAVHAVVGDFDRHLPLLPSGGDRLVVFLGGTIGNLDRRSEPPSSTPSPDSSSRASTCCSGPTSSRSRPGSIEAYDDAAGITAQFNKNVLSVMNRELDADFDLDRFVHEARWNADEERIEMWLRADSDLRIRVGALDLAVAFERGEAVRTELSCKFTPQRIDDELSAAGFAVAESWTDEQGDFALTLARRTPPPAR